MPVAKPKQRAPVEAPPVAIRVEVPAALHRKLKSAAPRIATGILYEARLVDPVAAARAAAADALCVDWGYLDRGLVDIAHRAGLGVFVWTVDDEQAIRRCRDLGVDGITSNDTRLIARLLGGA